MARATDKVKQKPQFQRGSGPNQLPQGGASQVNQNMPVIQPPFGDGSPPVEDIEIGPDETGFDSVLFNPTDRPTEAITSGAPFGDGPNAPNLPGMRDREYVKVIAAQIAEHRGLSSRSRNFLTRVARGE